MSYRGKLARLLISNGRQGLYGGIVESPVASQNSVSLPGAWQAVAQLLAAETGHSPAGFLHKDVSGTNIPIVKGGIGVEVDVRLSSSDHGELNSGGISFQHPKRLKRFHLRRWFFGGPGAALNERGLRQLRASP